MNTHVNFETAKLLKEKGFDITTKESYIERLEYSFLVRSAPTIAEVVMWLYETHKLWIEVNLGDYGFYWTITSKEINIVAESKYKIRINSPTEAYEAAIKHTLKHLI